MRPDYEYIESLPRIVYLENRKLVEVEYELGALIREKLFKAWTNGQKWSHSKFIVAARGEGNRDYVDYIISDDVFNWGIKSLHSTINNGFIQTLLGTNTHSVEFLEDLLNQIDESLMYYVNVKDRKGYKITISKENVDRIIDDLRIQIKDIDSEEGIKDLKYELCLYLHLLNYYDDDLYRYNKIFISGQFGYYRHARAMRFAQGIAGENGEYVILDYWIKKEEHLYTYMMATKFYDILKKYGVIWFNEGLDYLNYEILTKYVLLPHRLIGYQYFKDGIQRYYCINNHLLEEWKRNPNFEIGDADIYIEQDLNTLGNNFLSNIVYTIDGNLNYDTISLLDKRKA
jgi:hypothetical protein